jgi:hypothetical protein
MKKDLVVIGVYPETRRRINTHAAAKLMNQPDYIDSLVPAVPGETDAKTP